MVVYLVCLTTSQYFIQEKKFKKKRKEKKAMWFYCLDGRVSFLIFLNFYFILFLSFIFFKRGTDCFVVFKPP